MSTSTMQETALRMEAVLEMILAPLPLVSWAQVVAAEMPIPCWPRVQRPRPNFEEARYSPKTLVISSASMPGPLSSTRTRIWSEFLTEPAPAFSMITLISGRIPCSSQASKALSTASFSVVRTALVSDEKPTCWRFLEKYSAVLLVVIFAGLDLDAVLDAALGAGLDDDVAFFAIFPREARHSADSILSLVKIPLQDDSAGQVSCSLHDSYMGMRQRP